MKKSFTISALFSLIFIQISPVNASLNASVNEIKCTYEGGLYSSLDIENNPLENQTKIFAKFFANGSIGEQLGIGDNFAQSILFQSKDCLLSKEQTFCKGNASIVFHFFGPEIKKTLDTSLILIPSRNGHLATLNIHDKQDNIIASESFNFIDGNDPLYGCWFF